MTLHQLAPHEFSTKEKSLKGCANASQRANLSEREAIIDKMIFLKCLKENVVSLFLGLALVCAVALLSGCAGFDPESSSTRISHVGSTPPEKTCTIYIFSSFTVRSFNGEEVEWHADGFNPWAVVQIPEGNHTFVADYLRNTDPGNPRGGRVYKKGIVINYDFKAGHIYDLNASEGFPVFGMGARLTMRIRDLTDKTEKKW